MPDRNSQQGAIGSFTGRFTARRRDTSLVLEGSHLRLLFNAVGRHDLPTSLDGVRIERVGESTTPAEFQIASGGREFSIRARSLQIHERAALYGTAIRLPVFALRQKLLWTLLLTVARFAWGQALIRRLTGRKT